jgi:glycine/D-amino acid oxidase-like deaminating enzyme
MSQAKILIVGAGVFGASTALHLAQRGHQVTIIDPGPIPHPLAESTDISKIVRLEYGPDEEYLHLMEMALPIWRQWNAQQSRPLFHEVGVTFLSRTEMQSKGFEYESFRLLQAHGHSLKRLQGEEISQKFAAFSGFIDGYFNPQGGYAESGLVVSWLLEEAKKLGVIVREKTRAVQLIEENTRVKGIQCQDGEKIFADEVIVAAGSWVLDLLPELSTYFRTVGQPVFHIKPSRPDLFLVPGFTVFGGDIAKTGFYGFPLSSGGVVKIANHGIGREMHPDSTERVTSQKEEENLRSFLRQHIPALAEEEIVYRRICVYCDTLDEHFWIAQDPSREGLTISTGGSGHGFKFAPVLGSLISDAAFGKENPLLKKFRWRSEQNTKRGEEAARHR